MHAELKTQVTLFREITAQQKKTFMSCLEAHMSATNSRVDRFLTKMTQDVTELKTSLQLTSDDIADLKSSMAEHLSENHQSKMSIQ